METYNLVEFCCAVQPTRSLRVKLREIKDCSWPEAVFEDVANSLKLISGIKNLREVQILIPAAIKKNLLASLLKEEGLVNV